MKIIIPTYNRHNTIKTNKLFEHKNVILVTSNQQQHDMYRATLPLSTIMVCSNVTGNIAKKRQWILDNLVEEGEWFLMADDNIKKFRSIAEPWYSCEELDDTGTKMEQDASPETALDIILESCEEAEKRGAKFVGFRTNSNPFFGRRKWSEVSYVSTKMCLIKKDSSIKFDERFPLRDEVQFCAENLLRMGKVLVNKYLFPVANHYEAGGIGSLQDRLARRRIECRELMLKYPNLLKYKKNHKSTPEESDVQLRIHSIKQCEEWRSNMFSSVIPLEKDNDVLEGQLEIFSIIK